MTLRFSNRLLSSLSKAKGYVAANLTTTILYCIGFLLIILWLGDKHPVSPNNFFNLGYHIAAFIMTLLAWGVFAIGVGGVLFRAIEKPPAWAVLLFLTLTLLATVYGRLYIDQQLRKNAGLDGAMIERFEDDSFR